MRSVKQDGFVYLRDRRGAQWIRHDLPENLTPRAAVFLGDYLAYLRRHKARSIRAQALELFAVLHRDDLRMHGEQLTELNKGRAKLLEHIAQLFRAYALRYLIF